MLHITTLLDIAFAFAQAMCATKMKKPAAVGVCIQKVYDQ